MANETAATGEETEARETGLVTLKGPQKAAVMMITLGPDACAQIFKSLDEEDVEVLTAEIARLQGVTSDLREKVLEEFHEMAVAQRYILQGGVDYAKTALEAAVGTRKAREILEKVQTTIRTTGF